jgi:hypothetical protein
MATFEQKCDEFEANFKRLRIRRDDWELIRIDEVLPRLGGIEPDEFISRYNMRKSRILSFESGSQKVMRDHGIVLTAGHTKRKVVYLKRLTL